MIDDIKKDAADAHGEGVAALSHELKKLRTGRAHTSLLEHVRVDYYGTEMPLTRWRTSRSRTPARWRRRPGRRAWCRRSRRPSETRTSGSTPTTAGSVIRVPLPAADRGAPQGPRPRSCATRPRRRASRCATCAATCMHELKEMLKEKLVSEDEERARPGRGPEAHRQARRRRSTRCCAEKEKELMQV